MWNSALILEQLYADHQKVDLKIKCLQLQRIFCSVLIPAMDAVINETILPAIKALGAMLVNIRFRVGAKTPSVANAIPMEPKLANPIMKT